MSGTALSELFAAYEAEGLARGKERAREKGLEGDEAAGFAKSFADGYAIARITGDIAERLLAQDLSQEHVAEVAGISLDRVKGIAATMRR